MLEDVLYTVEVMNGVRCVLWALGVMLCVLFCNALCAAPCAAPYAALNSGGRGGRVLFA